MVPTASSLDVARLEREFDTIRATYTAAVPFQHVVIENVLESADAERVSSEYPGLGAVQRSWARLLEARSYDGDVRRFGEAFVRVYDALNSERFTSWLRRLTGIEDLQMDPDLVGGGLHQGARGSTLHIHADHNTHPHDPTRYRRVNVLIYLNDDWNPKWGGDLELFDGSGSRRVVSIAPLFNRAVIMDVHDRAFHGYQPLQMPSNLTRKSLAAYYYSNSPGALQTVQSHPTILAAFPDSRRLSNAVARVRRWILNRSPSIGGLRPKDR